MLMLALMLACGLSVTGVDTSSGEAGNTIVLEGSGFDERTRVTFGPIEAARVVALAPNRIAVVVPPGSGTVDVCVSNSHERDMVPASFRYGGESIVHSDDGWVMTCPETVVDTAIAGEPVTDGVLIAATN